jgi:hypothetical protein
LGFHRTLPGRFLDPSRPARAASETGETVDSSGSGGISKKGRTLLAVTAVLFIVLVAFLLYGLGTFNSPPPSSATQTATYITSSTSYDTVASSVISSATANLPAGYVQGSTKQLTPRESGLVSAGYALYSNQAGAFANMTIIVFNSTTSAQRYGDSVMRNDQALGGYTDVTSILSGYQHYGACYGFAESDPEGGEYVAYGVCIKGNVYIYVDVASTSSLPSAESDMSGFVGAAYTGLG